MRKSWNKNAVLYILFVFSVVFVPLTTEKYIYIPMLIVMCISSLQLIMVYKKADKNDALLVFMALFMLISGLYNRESLRWSSLLFTCLYIATFMYYSRILVISDIPSSKLLHFFETIIKAYALVLAIQQISVILGLPVFNSSYGSGAEHGLKQGSLSIEPSNTGPIVTIILYSFIKIKESYLGHIISLNYLFKEKRSLLFSYIYVCLGSGSVTCLLAFFVMAFYFFKKKYLILYIIVALVFGSIFIYLSPEVSQRVSVLLPALASMDPSLVYEVDPSGSARIGPYLLYFQEFNLKDINFWLGHGMDYGGIHVLGTMSGQEADSSYGVGGMINFLYDNGILAGLFFLWFVFKLCRFKGYRLFLYIVLFSQVAINHYIQWLCIFLLYTINYYERDDIKLVISYDVPSKKKK